MFSLINFLFVRRKSSNSFQHPDYIIDISLQPRTNRQVFATVCKDEQLRLFDIRKSGNSSELPRKFRILSISTSVLKSLIYFCLKGSVFQTVKILDGLRTITFSPTNSSLFAVAGYNDEVILYDIRRPTRLK